MEITELCESSIANSLNTRAALITVFTMFKFVFDLFSGTHVYIKKNRLDYSIIAKLKTSSGKSMSQEKKVIYYWLYRIFQDRSYKTQAGLELTMYLCWDS